MTLFRDVVIGQCFDWVGPRSDFNSFYARCIKTGARTYREIEDDGKPTFTYRVGSINATVYHVGAD